MASKKSKTVRLKVDENKAKKKEEAKKQKSEKQLRKELKKEIREEELLKKRRRKEIGRKIYDEAEDVRTPEQIEHSNKVHAEVDEYLRGQYIYSKFGNVLRPRAVWRRFSTSFCDPSKPREPIRVVETETVKEIVKPNKTYLEYLNTRDEVPEEVIMKGFKHILEEYGIDKLDDYTSRKLFYHILLSIGHYLDVNPEFYLSLSDIHIYREPLVRNVFTVIIPEASRRYKDVTVDSLYNYYAGGEIDIEALNKTLDIYALSYIEYTEVKKDLREKARESANRFKRIVEQTEQAKAMLKAQGITGGPGYRTVVKEVREQLDKEHRARNQKNTNKNRWGKKDLTDDNICGIIEEKKDKPEDSKGE